MQTESPGNNESQDRVWVKDIASGQAIQSLFQITRLDLREFDRGKFLLLRLGDKTGKISAVMWEQAEEASKVIVEGDIVIVQGRASIYQGEMQVKIKTITKFEDQSQINITDFLPSSPTPVKKLIADFDEIIETIADEDYKELLLSFRCDDDLWNRFTTAPGAKRWHHPYIHGLLDHTLSVVKICRLIAPFYPEINPDLLLTGAIFHDCGKLEEYIYDTKIDFSTEGRLVGHLFQGSFIVERLITQIDGFPAEKRMLLLHMMASHHGEIERSPVFPMTIEACFLHHIENMDAQMTAIRREMKIAQNENKSWTRYINLMGRALYLGENQAPSNNTDE
jgi:3'-5' exoribonuclease